MASTLVSTSKICRPLVFVLVLDKREVLFGFSVGISRPLAGFSCHQLSSPLLKGPVQPSAHKNIKLHEFVPQPYCGCTFSTHVAQTLAELLSHKEGRKALENPSEQWLPCVPCQHCHPGGAGVNFALRRRLPHCSGFTAICNRVPCMSWDRVMR